MYSWSSRGEVGLGAWTPSSTISENFGFRFQRACDSLGRSVRRIIMWRSRKTHVPPVEKPFPTSRERWTLALWKGVNPTGPQKIFVRPIDPRTRASFSLHRNVNDLLVDPWTESNQMLRYHFEEITKASLCYKAKETSRIFMIGGASCLWSSLTSYVSDAWLFDRHVSRTFCMS
jgi:hypothetical protein